MTYKREYLTISDESVRDLTVWEWSRSVHDSVARIRSSSIGQLLISLSEGENIESAVTAYERMVAPENYRRPKAIFTKKMLDDARNKIEELGYMSALSRRYAVLDDISVNNILFANRDVSKNVFGLEKSSSDLFSSLEKEVKTSPKSFDKAQVVTIDDFVSNILPTANYVSVLFDSSLSKNLVSLIAPTDKDSKGMFKWDNKFSWAYSGNMTDSVLKQNVKNFGGKVDGVLRFSIQWNDVAGEWDKNDEDAHCVEPNGFEIHYSRKVDTKTGGNLDVDIINPSKGVPAVENITWPDISKMKFGDYRFFVHCFSNRGGRTGFRAEIEFDGKIYSYDYNKPLRQGEIVDVAVVTLSKDNKFSIRNVLNSDCSSRSFWGIQSGQFVPVSVIMNSPNYWDEQKGIGAKHTFFMLDGCKNDESPNPFFNEFLNDDFKDYKRVMEALGSKAHVEDSDNQLSGVGFNHTQHDSVVVKVKSDAERVYRIRF